MQKKLINVLVVLLAAAAPFVRARSLELPRPCFAGNFFLTFYRNVTDSADFFADAARLRRDFAPGVYLRSGVSQFFTVPPVWNESPARQQEILNRGFAQIREKMEICRRADICLHPGFGFGFVRSVGLHNAAKKADLRNCQWYGDGKLASDAQLQDESFALNRYVWLTLSRYALKLREKLKFRCLALGAYLANLEQDFPDVFVAASGDGEVELNSGRMDGSCLDFPVCDYSPFVILEFRDWILHQGLYADSTGVYAGQGYARGGSLYAGEKGLGRFNLEFGTDFQTWKLKYYDFTLEQTEESVMAWDQVKDKSALLPESGPGFTAGGFDAPRKRRPGHAFWLLWERFRQEMVRNFTRDIARWVCAGGLSPERWYSHQIPADYLWGSSPEQGSFAARLLSSASPLWTADVAPWGNMGLTCFDIRFPAGYRRTSEYLLEFMAQRDRDWALLEFDPFTVPPQFNLDQEQNSALIRQVYSETLQAAPHLVSIHCWDDRTGEHRTVGTAKYGVLKNLWRELTDLPWKTAMPALYFPPAVRGLKVTQKKGVLQLTWQKEIWYGCIEQWPQIPLFTGFEVWEKKAGKKAVCVKKTGNFYAHLPLHEDERFYYVRAVFVNGNRSIDCEKVVWPAALTPRFVQQRIRVQPEYCRGYVRIAAPENAQWRLMCAGSQVTVKPSEGTGPGLANWNLDSQTLQKKQIPRIQEIKLLNDKGQVLDTCYLVIEITERSERETKVNFEFLILNFELKKHACSFFNAPGKVFPILLSTFYEACRRQKIKPPNPPERELCINSLSVFFRNFR